MASGGHIVIFICVLFLRAFLLVSCYVLQEKIFFIIPLNMVILIVPLSMIGRTPSV
jgi:hypothetical protein